jgi:hypothetical protein
MNMKNARKFLFAASAVFCASSTFSASAAETTNNVGTNNGESLPRPLYREWTVGIEGGSEGIFGLLGSWRFSDHVGARLATDYAHWSFGGAEIAGIHYDAKIRLLNEPLTLDIYPWKKHSFYIGFGWMFNQNQLSGSASDNGTINIDGHPFPTDRVGSLNMKVEQQPVNPYLSIGGNFFYFDHAHHWAMGGELGVAYTGDPRVSLTRSGPADPVIDAALTSAQNHLQRFADQYKWWPVVKLSVSYSF